MKRVTVADLAKASGVSVATVNRLLHGSGPVRNDTAERITDAANEIGFYGLGTIKVRRRENLPHRKLGFLLQQSHRKLYQNWAAALTHAAEQRLDAVLEAVVNFEDDLTAERVAEHALKLGGAVDALAIISADHPLISQAVDTLCKAGTPVVAYISDLSAASRAGFVGTDNWKLGRTAAWFIQNMSSKPGKIIPLIGSNRYQCQDIADASFRSYLRELAPELQVGESLLTHEVPETAYSIVSGILRAEPELRGIFVNGGGISGVLRALREHSDAENRAVCVVCRDVGPEARSGVAQGYISAALRHPENRMSEELIEVMLRLLERKSSTTIVQRIVPFEVVTPESLWT